MIRDGVDGSTNIKGVQENLHFLKIQIKPSFKVNTVRDLQSCHHSTSVQPPPIITVQVYTHLQ